MICEPDEVVKTLKNLKDQANEIEGQIFDIVINTPNGGISVLEAWNLSFRERQIIVKKINEYNAASAPSSGTDYIVNQQGPPRD